MNKNRIIVYRLPVSATSYSIAIWNGKKKNGMFAYNGSEKTVTYRRFNLSDEEFTLLKEAAIKDYERSELDKVNEVNEFKEAVLSSILNKVHIKV